MPIHPPSRRRALIVPALIFGALVNVLLVGCQQSEDVTHYQAERAETPMIRLRVAIFKSADRTWFFKVLGAKDVVDAHADAFEHFIHSVRFSTDEKTVEWTAPPSWQKLPTDGQRYAAFQIGPSETAAELTVIPLGGQAGSVIENVNRWRSQLGLRPIPEDALKDNLTEEMIGDQRVLRVELTASGRYRKAETPRMPLGKAPSDSGLVYDAPEGWKKMPQPPEFAIAGFTVQEGGKTAKVSVTQMSPQPLPANVKRWRDQLGLQPIDGDQLRDLVQTINVAGTPAQSLDMTGQRDRMLVVLAAHDKTTWIFKMSGPPDLVGKQKPEFEKFVRSVRFDGGSHE